MAWNGLMEQNIVAGRKLTIFVPDKEAGAEDGADEPAEPEGTESADPLADSTQEGQSVPDIDIQLIDEEVADEGGAGDEATGEAPKETATHVVGPGETLTSIANQYEVSVDAIVELNSIEDPSKVLVGQKLKVPKP
jgi:LysM repeat protein